MAKLPSAFKRKDHGSMRDFSAIPGGEYFIKATDSSYEKNSKKNGHILKFVWTVQKGDHKGSKLFTNLNLDNPSEKAMEIANDEFGTICDACGGKVSVKDSSVLHGILLKAKVAFIKGEDGNPDRNEIKMYMPATPDGDEPEVDEPEDEPEKDDEVDGAAVKALALKYKKMTSGKKLKSALSEYDISKASEIEDMDEDDIVSLKDDLEELIEDAEEDD